MERFLSILLSLRFRYEFARHLLWSTAVFLLAVILALFVFQTDDVVTQTVGWEKNFTVSTFKIRSKDVAVASRGNYIAAVYEGREGDGKSIYASISFNGGSSFLSPVKITDIESKVESSPHVAVSGKGQIAVAWHVFKEDEFTNRIYFSTSENLGAQWTPPVRIEMGVGMEMLPNLFYDNREELHLFFQGNKGDSFNLYHARNRAGGAFETTGPIIELSEQLLGAFFPSINLSGNKFFIVWQGRSGAYVDDLFFIRSFNGGNSWGGKERITRSMGSSVAPSVFFHRNSLYVVYQNNENRSWEINMLKGNSTGESWSTLPQKVSTTNVNCYSPVVVPSGEDLMIVWYDGREGNNNIYARKYIIGENKFGEEMRISTRDIDAKRPKAVAVENKVVAMWEEAGVIMGKSTDVHVDPPAVYSKTHPESVWSKEPIAVVAWKAPKDESGIVSYRTMYTKRPDPRPFVDPPLPTKDGNETQQVITDLGEGVSYFHIRAEDGAGNLSRTVHYKILVSINPITLPVVVSPSHPQGQPVPSNAPLFRWLLANREDGDRLKGFYFAISKDYSARPDTFTTNFETSFSNLEEGRYFFRIAAVDKSNRLSQVATYDIVVGKAEPIDPELLKKIAQEEKEYTIEKDKDKVVIKIERIPRPGVSIDLPFDASRPYKKREFRGILVTRDIPRENIIGFSVLVDKNRSPLPATVTTKTGILDVKNLADGDYFLGVKCKFFTMERGEKRYHWTSTSYRRIHVRLEQDVTPLDRTLGLVAGRVTVYPLITAIFFAGLGISIVTVGYGRRISFGAELIRHRVRILMDRIRS